MRDPDSRLIEAIVGALVVTALLLAAFSVVAQELAATDRVVVRLAEWADQPAAQACPTSVPAR